MDRRLLQPKWFLASLVVLVVAAIFVWLGFWQLGRLDERQAANAVGERQSAQPSIDLDQILVESGADYSQIEYRNARTTGIFDVDSEVLARSQVYRGTAGFHVITPLIKEDGTAVLVNRGWGTTDDGHCARRRSSSAFQSKEWLKVGCSSPRRDPLLAHRILQKVDWWLSVGWT